MKDYNKSDYAINKYSKGIVYKFVDGSTLEVTFEMIAEGDPNFTQEKFEELKNKSDAIYHEIQKGDAKYEDHIETSTNTSETVEKLKTKSLEDAFFKKYDDIVFDTKFRKLIDTKLTPTQRRRVLMRIEGLSTPEIANIEGCNQNAIWECLKYAKEKISKFL